MLGKTHQLPTDGSKYFKLGLEVQQSQEVKLSQVKTWTRSYNSLRHIQGDHFPDHMKFPDFSSRGRPGRKTSFGALRA